MSNGKHAEPSGSALVMGGRYRARSGILVDHGHWLLQAADVDNNKARLVPENSGLPICWESTIDNLHATFELVPNAPDHLRAVASRPEPACSASLCKCGHASWDHFNGIGVCHKCACQGWMTPNNQAEERR